MKEILEAKLASVRKALKDAYEECDQEGIIYHSGREELLEDLISQQNEMLYSDQQNAYENGYYGFDDAEFEDNNPYYYFSDIDRYMLERRDLIEEQVENAHNNLHFTRGIGKSVINSDNHWFTSDEVEAFRVIWQRRISAM
jgi:isoleucyl-tRNA synthetase